MRSWPHEILAARVPPELGDIVEKPLEKVIGAARCHWHGKIRSAGLDVFRRKDFQAQGLPIKPGDRLGEATTGADALSVAVCRTCQNRRTRWALACDSLK